MRFFKAMYIHLKDKRNTLLKFINFLAIYAQVNFLHNSFSPFCLSKNSKYVTGIDKLYV